MTHHMPNTLQACVMYQKMKFVWLKQLQIIKTATCNNTTEALNYLTVQLEMHI